MASTIAGFMGQDHDRLDELFKQFQACKRRDVSKAITLFVEFMTGLQRHIVWEEEILFPVFERQAEMMQGHGPTTVMRVEHQQIHTLLQQIHDAVSAGNPETDEFERRLLEVLGAHNVKEERVLYPWIDKLVSEGDRASLIDRMQNLPPDSTSP